jgi:hypothetical protein
MSKLRADSTDDKIEKFGVLKGGGRYTCDYGAQFVALQSRAAHRLWNLDRRFPFAPISLDDVDVRYGICIETGHFRCSAAVPFIASPTPVEIGPLSPDNLRAG